MEISRRQVLRAGAAAGALLVADPARVLAGAGSDRRSGEPAPFGTDRQSRLLPGSGRFVVHSDLHNHTKLSDGATAAEEAFELLRAARLDVAALTDHAVFGNLPAQANRACSSCSYYTGINESSWRTLNRLADRSNLDGEFVAMRGFEWTTGTIGHVNVWFTQRWIDAFSTLGLQSSRGLPVLFNSIPEPGPTLHKALAPLFDQLPETATIDLFYEWLQSPSNRPVQGGGVDGLAGFNHPNLYGDFEGFKLEAGLVDRMVSCEALNGHDDYLFWGLDEGQPSPLNACLNAGWRVGMLGVSDEHFDGWADGKARGGLWVDQLTRAGVREAMYARRFYATFEPGLRLDATANGVQMGGVLRHRAGPVRFVLDLDRGADWYGRSLQVQVLRPGEVVPHVTASLDVTLPAPDQPLLSFDVDLRLDEGSWILLRVTDPTRPTDPRAPAPYDALGGALAYASPFFLTA